MKKYTDASAATMDAKKSPKLGLVSGVYIPVFLNIMSILMFLRFGLILGKVGFLGTLGLLVTAYCVNLLTILSLSAIASNGEVKGGGAYYLISRSLGPEFGGSIGILFFLAQALNTALNVVGLLDCIRLNVGPAFPQGYWTTYGLETAVLLMCMGMCLLGSATFAKASNLLLAILTVAILSIPVSVIFKAPFTDQSAGIVYTGPNLNTLVRNFLPSFDKNVYQGFVTFRDLFGILFPATSGIFAGASMSGDLKSPSRAIPKGTLWATLTTFIVYVIVILSMSCSISRASFLANVNIVSLINLSAPVILAGECAVTVFSALMGIMGSAKLFQAMARDELLPGLSIFGRGTQKHDEPILAILLTYFIAQVAMLADLNQIATFISMGYQMTFFVMNLACFLLKIASAPNFRPSFKWFNWQTAWTGSLLSAAAMFFIDQTYAAIAICALVFLFLLIHYLCPPKRWGDVSQNLIYHQVRKYLLRLKPEHIKFWRPHIILLINNPRRQTRLIQFCNSMKKGSLYILGHVIVTDDFGAGVNEARLQQQAWTRYISEYSRIKAFVQLTMSPSITWGVRNLVLAAGLGGMRPNIAVMGFYNMDDLRKSYPSLPIPDVPASPAARMTRRPTAQDKTRRRRRGDTSARLLEGVLPTDTIRTEGMMSPTAYMLMLEDLALQYRLNVAVAQGFEKLETPRRDGSNSKQYIDLWPIQMSAEVSRDGQNVVTTNFDTYTLILQLGNILHSVRAWHNVFTVRVMVFVEYEHEVDEESARVKALLEKLRIDAHVLVFHLASGNLNTYELIVNGRRNDIDTEIVVSEALKDEVWWDNLQTFRRQTSGELWTSQGISQLAHVFDATLAAGRGYNPHGDGGRERNRPSLAKVPDLPKKKDIASLSKLGVSMGIHTTHINDDVLQESQSDTDDETEAGATFEEDGYGFGVDAALNTTFPQNRDRDASRRPLLGSTTQEHVRKTSEMTETRSTKRFQRRKPDHLTINLPAPSYGTLATSQTLSAKPDIPITLRAPGGAETGLGTPNPPATAPIAQIESFPVLEPLQVPEFPSKSSRRSRSRSPPGGRTPSRDTPARPAFSRQSSAVRFSSRPVPETTITAEGENSKISFATTVSNPPTPWGERPGMGSRHSSFGKYETGTSFERPKFDHMRSISFAHLPAHQPPHSASRPRHHTRHGSTFSIMSQDGLVSAIPEYGEYFSHEPSEVASAADSSSTYSGHGGPLSFNDLPSRAQHLILNELMKQQSKQTAVLMTVLPIPSEGTSQDEVATINYLSDVELLCDGLPPTLLVLSNNMTVTVSL